jgi:hypothetical protein
MALRKMLALLFICLFPLVASAADLALPEEEIAFELKGEIVDIHTSLGITPEFRNMGLTKGVKSVDLVIESAEAVKPGQDFLAVTAFLKQESVTANTWLPQACQKVLLKHRKPLGLGVKGKLKVTGILYVGVEETKDGSKSLTSRLHIITLDGEKGKYKSK